MNTKLIIKLQLQQHPLQKGKLKLEKRLTMDLGCCIKKLNFLCKLPLRMEIYIISTASYICKELRTFNLEKKNWPMIADYAISMLPPAPFAYHKWSIYGTDASTTTLYLFYLPWQLVCSFLLSCLLCVNWV
jgi:hypothetical protein